MYRGAMRSIVSELIRQERLVVVETFKRRAPKTKAWSAKLGKLGLDDVLIVVRRGRTRNLYLAARNLPHGGGRRDVAEVDPVRCSPSRRC